MTAGGSGAIGAYLTDLRQALAQRAGGDEAAEEVESHLLDLRDELMAGGLGLAEAERTAVQRFGSAATIVEGHRSLLLPVGYEIAAFVAVVMCTLGLTGLAAIAVRTALGEVAFTGDIVSVLVGAAGSALAEFLWLRRDGRTTRPDSPIPAVATGVLAAAGVVLLTVATLDMAGIGLGSPEIWLVLAFAAFGAALVSRHLRDRLRGDDPAVRAATTTSPSPRR